MKPDEFLKGLFDDNDRVAIFLRQPGSGQIEQRASQIDQIVAPRYLAWLGHRNNEGYDVYVSMQTLREGAWTRTKGDIQDIRTLYCDIDIAGPATVNTILASAKVPTPNYVLTTSPGKNQVIWKVCDLDKSQAENYLRGLVAEFKTDPAATDISRVLRIPGFENRKYPEHPIVTAHRHSHEIYKPSDFNVRLDLAPAMVWQATGRTMPEGYRSPSERDWGWTLHKLEKGVPAPVVERELAQKAAERGKHSGNERLIERYAHRTVEKAAQHLRSHPAQSPEYAR
jgi:hypothetical protein